MLPERAEEVVFIKAAWEFINTYNANKRARHAHELG